MCDALGTARVTLGAMTQRAVTDTVCVCMCVCVMGGDEEGGGEIRRIMILVMGRNALV